MIIVDAATLDGKQTQLVVQPANLLLNLSESWRASLGLAYDAVIKAGYWVKNTNNQRLRLATREEIKQYEALVTVVDLAAELTGDL